MDNFNGPSRVRRFHSKRLTLIQKLVISYAAIAFFIIAALAISAYGLYSLNRTAREIARNDLPFLSSLAKLRSSVLAQEGLAGKYEILRSPDFIELFRQREKEAVDLIGTLGRTRSAREITMISGMYEEYRSAAADIFKGKDESTRVSGLAVKIIDAIDVISSDCQTRLNRTLAAADRQQRSTVRWTSTLSFSGFFLAICVAAFFSYRFTTAIRALKKATHRIAEGDFDYDPQIPPDDEIGDLARDFTSMAARLKVLEQMSLDASPLTRLPGNIAIERVLERRLHNGEQFAVCYADLDNFKAFNDRYGYVKGSELIKTTGGIIYEAAHTHGDRDAFVGHVGGDDFVAVVAADHVTEVCEAAIFDFDRSIIDYYNPEDVGNGGINGVDRYGVDRFFPLMTISIAVIICSREEFSSAVEIARAAAEIKDFVKEKPGSNFLISRRRHSR